MAGEIQTAAEVAVTEASGGRAGGGGLKARGRGGGAGWRSAGVVSRRLWGALAAGSLASLGNPQGWLVCAVGFLIGRVSLFGLLEPFGIALLIAAGGWKAGLRLPLAFALLAGSATLGGWSALPRPALGAILALLLSALAAGSRPAAKEVPSLRRLAGAAGGAAALSAATFLLWLYPPAYAAALATADGLIAAALVPVLRLGLGALEPPEGELAPIEEGSLLCLALLCSLGTAGAVGLEAGPFDARAVLAALVTLIGAWRGGPAWGAAAGVSADAAAVLTGILPFASSFGVQALAGLLGGLFRESGRLAILAGYASAWILAWLPRAGELPAAPPLWGTALAGVLFLLPPRRFWRWVLPGVAAAPTTGIDWYRRVQGMAHRAEEEAARRLREFARVFEELSRSFEQVAAGREAAGREAAAAADGADERGDPGSGMPEEEAMRLIDGLAAAVCAGCSRFRPCWEKDFFGTYRDLFSLLAQAEQDGPVDAASGSRSWHQRCIRRAEMAQAINHRLEVNLVERRWRIRFAESRRLAAAQLAGLAGVLEDLAGQVEQAPARVPRRGRDTWLDYETGLAKASRGGAAISGDSHLVRCLGTQLIAVLSDGMGSGSRAAVESHTAVRLLERLLESGFQREAAVRSLNSILLLRSSEETFATVDLAVIDLQRGDAEFLKVGAAPSFLVRQSEVRLLPAGSLPLGILQSVDMEVTRLPVQPGDRIVMVSDGILGARPDGGQSPLWVRDYLRQAVTSDPQELASGLLAEAIAMQSGRAPDDMTALVIELRESLV